MSKLIISHLIATLLCVGIFWIAPAHAAIGAPRRAHGLRLNMRALSSPLAPPQGDRSRSMRASYYGGGERLNAHTANGERFAPHGYTAAHRSLPFGTRLRVCLSGCVTVRVNDRGPAAWTGRSLDLSRGAASAIGLIGPGVAMVRVSRI